MLRSGRFASSLACNHTKTTRSKRRLRRWAFAALNFIALVQRNGAEIQLNAGEVIVTTISGNVVPMNVPRTVLTIDSQGNTQGPTPVSQPLVNFADLGPPVTNTALSDAAAAFAAVTGDTTIGAAGGGGGR